MVLILIYYNSKFGDEILYRKKEIDRLANQDYTEGPLFRISEMYSYGTGFRKDVTFNKNQKKGYIYYYQIEKDYIYKFFKSNIQLRRVYAYIYVDDKIVRSINSGEWK